MSDSVLNAQGDDLVYGGEQDPRVIPINAPKGAMYIFAPIGGGTPEILQKQDDGSTTNWNIYTTGMATDFSNHDPSTVDVNLGGNKIINLADPTLAQDAATMNYVDTLFTSLDNAKMDIDFSNHDPSTVNINLGTNKIINLADPTLAQDGATKNYVDTQVAAIDLSGKMDTDFSNHDPSTVNIDLGTNKIINLADPTLAQDGATKNYVDTQISTIDLSGKMDTDFSNHDPSTVNIDLGTNKIINLADPTLAQDGATKNYVDTNLSTKANTDLGNLDGGGINNNLIPSADATRQMGSAIRRWKQLHMRDSVDFGGIPVTYYNSLGVLALIKNGNNLPSGNQHDFGIATREGNHLGLYSENRGVGDTGTLYIESGNATTNNSGNIELYIGTSPATRGSIIFKDGSEGTIGHVWTSKGVNGEGEWAPAPATGANTSLSNLTSPTSINQSLLPDANNLRDLGTNLNGFSKAFFKSELRSPLISAYDGAGATAVVGSLIGGSFNIPSGPTVRLRLAQSNIGSNVADKSLAIFTNTQVSDFRGSGNLYLETGNLTGTGAFGSGLVSILSGSLATTTSGVSGGITINSGDTGSGLSGVINIKTGNSDSGNSGTLELQTGLAPSGLRGDIQLEGNRVDASTSVGPLRVPNLAADPASPLNGDLWYNVTSNELKARVNGVTVILA